MDIADDPRILLVEALGFDNIEQDMRGNLIVTILANSVIMKVIIEDTDRGSVVMSKLVKAQYCIDYMEGNIKCATSTSIG